MRRTERKERILWGNGNDQLGKEEILQRNGNDQLDKENSWTQRIDLMVQIKRSTGKEKT